MDGYLCHILQAAKLPKSDYRYRDAVPLFSTITVNTHISLERIAFLLTFLLTFSINTRPRYLNR